MDTPWPLIKMQWNESDASRMKCDKSKRTNEQWKGVGKNLRHTYSERRREVALTIQTQTYIHTK